MKDFIKVMGSLIDRILGYMLAIMFAISFFIKDISTIILSGVLLTGFTIMSIYVEDVSRRLEALKELEKILEKWKRRVYWMKKININNGVYNLKKQKLLGRKMKYFVRLSIILGPVIIVMSIIKFQENNLKHKIKGNKDVQEKQQQEILDICRINKVMKIYSQNDGENFYVVLENKNIYKVDEDKLGNYTIGEYCK